MDGQVYEGWKANVKAKGDILEGGKQVLLF
jgi:hypothetical protein